MAFDRIMIAPFNSGLVNAVRPWLVPNDAFSIMQNAYVYRQRVKKRFGSRWLGNTQQQTRLRVNIGTHDANPKTVTLPGTENFAIGQMISIGLIEFTIWQLGPGVATLSSDAGYTGSIDTGTRQFTVTGAVTGSTIYWYPALPVMGLIQQEQSSINIEKTIAFDTRYAYQYVGTTGWERLDTGGAAALWSGTNAEFFWGVNWQGDDASVRLLFVTNYNQNDGMRYLNNITWATFNPKTLATVNNDVITARLMVVFHNRLILLNTIENVAGTPKTFVNRARWSQVGSPIDADAFQTDVPGKGGGQDAATTEAIITCGFIKDRLIVYFERSTWELAYTGNEVDPFTWYRINTELGAESTFSVVPFDKVLLAIGNVGVHACNGQNVDRIDQNIPQEVFKIRDDSDGVYRVNGIRDYFAETVYWSFPSSTDTSYPNRVLVYNYELKAWAFNDDSITVFGYIQPSTGITWDDETASWDDPISWDSGALQPRFRAIIAGNQEGFTFYIDSDTGISRNSCNLQITNMTTGGVLTVIDHNLLQGQWVRIENALGITELNDKIFKIQSVTATTIVLDLRDIVPTGAYIGDGVLATVSQINMLTKQFNIYAKQGKNAYVSKVDFLVDRVNDATITVDYYASSSDVSLVFQGAISGSLLGNGTLDLGPYSLYPQEATQERLWHPVYLNAEGEVVQLQIYYSDAEMIDPTVSLQPFELHAFTLYTQPVGRLQ